MQGDFITINEARRRNLVIDTTNSTTSVSSSLSLTFTAPPNHTINCVLAASLNMNGNVRLIAGGIGFNNVTLAYETSKGRQDFLFVQIESNAEDRVNFRENVADNSRIAIFYDKFKDWMQKSNEGQEEIGNQTDGAIV